MNGQDARKDHVVVQIADTHPSEQPHRHTTCTDFSEIKPVANTAEMVPIRGMRAAVFLKFHSNLAFSLPENIETAVCNEGIKLQNFLYNLFWNTGAWYVIPASPAVSASHMPYEDAGSSKYK